MALEESVEGLDVTGFMKRTASLRRYFGEREPSHTDSARGGRVACAALPRWKAGVERIQAEWEKRLDLQLRSTEGSAELVPAQ